MSARRRFQLVVLAVLTVVSVGLQLWLYDWYIEDAAISFAFARNWASGDGLVAVPGMERVEGYSNPTWVALMSLFELVGVHGFISSKVLGVVFGAACVPLTWAIAGSAFDAPDDDRPLVAAALLALNPQFAIWNASGLENSLFSFLLAAGLWRTLREAADVLDPARPRPSRWPLAALWFLALTLTRPEGIAYAAVGGLFAMLFTIADGLGLWPTIRWLVTFFVPWGAYQAWHYHYFAWAFPNTYYAKMGDKEFRPFAWDARGWTYLRGWASDTGQAVFAPMYALALSRHGWRRRVAGALSATYLLMLLVPGPEWLRKSAYWPTIAVPDGWLEARIVVMIAATLLLPLVTVGLGRRSRSLVMSWYMIVVSLFFVLWSGGDWMRGYRWLSLCAVPGSVVLGHALAVAIDAVQRSFSRPRERWGAVAHGLAWPLVLGVAAPGLMGIDAFRGHPETSPYAVKHRVEYKHYVARRLHLDQVRDLDVDQGAHVWWSGFQMYDVAGLIDVPMAHHDHERPFMQEYILDEVKPHFAHLHGGWAATSGLTRMQKFKDEYFEIPGYPSGKKNLHIGNFVRRELMNVRKWLGRDGREVRYRSGVRLAGFEIPADKVSVNRKFYVEVGLRSELQRAFRVVLFVADQAGHLQSWALPPGYDWLEPADWATDEVFVGRFSLDLPAELPEGSYDVGFFVTDAEGAPLGFEGDQWLAMADGSVLRRTAVPEGARIGRLADGSARFADGEVVFPGALTLVSRDEGKNLASADVDAARARASEGDCEGAEAVWGIAQHRMTQDDDWIAGRQPKTARALARCWLTRARAAASDAERVAPLAQAHRWEPSFSELVVYGDEVAARLFAAGEAARTRGDADAAYAQFTSVLSFAPHWSWARRYAEEARDRRLGLDVIEKPPPGARRGAPRAPVPVTPDGDNE
jgi:hypothetical protein